MMYTRTLLLASILVTTAYGAQTNTQKMTPVAAATTASQQAEFKQDAQFMHLTPSTERKRVADAHQQQDIQATQAASQPQGIVANAQILYSNTIKFCGQSYTYAELVTKIATLTDLEQYISHIAAVYNQLDLKNPDALKVTDAIVQAAERERYEKRKKQAAENDIRVSCLHDLRIDTDKLKINVPYTGKLGINELSQMYQHYQVPKTLDPQDTPKMLEVIIMAMIRLCDKPDDATFAFFQDPKNLEQPPLNIAYSRKAFGNYKIFCELVLRIEEFEDIGGYKPESLSHLTFADLLMACILGSCADRLRDIGDCGTNSRALLLKDLQNYQTQLKNQKK